MSGGGTGGGGGGGGGIIRLTTFSFSLSPAADAADDLDSMSGFSACSRTVVRHAVCQAHDDGDDGSRQKGVDGVVRESMSEWTQVMRMRRRWRQQWTSGWRHKQAESWMGRRGKRGTTRWRLELRKRGRGRETRATETETPPDLHIRARVNADELFNSFELI